MYHGVARRQKNVSIGEKWRCITPAGKTPSRTSANPQAKRANHRTNICAYREGRHQWPENKYQNSNLCKKVSSMAV